jgi:hypothetical protein
MLTQLLVKLICWTKGQKKATINSIFSKTKAYNYYSGPILDIMFIKWFPLSEVPSPITTLEALMSPTNQKC